MSLTDVEVCSSALAMIGANPISSLTDGNAEAKICAAIYEITVQDAISTYRWRFASGQELLNRLTDEPIAGRWDSAYQKPPELLTVSAVRAGGATIPYEIMGDNIYSHTGSETEVFAEGTYRVNEDKWPPYFTRLIELRLASKLAQSLAERTDLANSMDAQAMRQASVARTADSQSRTARQLNMSRFTARRFRGSFQRNDFYS